MNKIPLVQLTDNERTLVFECLKCAAAGEVILHDREFQSIIGVEVKEVLAVVDKWPAVDDSEEKVFLAIHNSLNNLLGYPHGKHSKWNEYISAPQSEVARVFAKWRGEPVSSRLNGIR